MGISPAPQINPDPTGTLPKAIELVNTLPIHPDFIVFTGDLTHTTDDYNERRKRMAEFKEVVAGLKNKNIKFLAGEHDAALDNGKAFHEFFGKSTYTFKSQGGALHRPGQRLRPRRRGRWTPSCSG